MTHPTPSPPKPRTRGKGRMTLAIKDSVEVAFGKANKGGRYLAFLAKEHPAVFVTLVAKCIPQAVNVDVHHHAVNLGLEMRRAADALDRLNHAPAMIDVTPGVVVANTVAPGTVVPDTVPDDPGEGEPGDV